MITADRKICTLLWKVYLSFPLGSPGDGSENYPWEDQEEWDTTDKVNNKLLPDRLHPSPGFVWTLLKLFIYFAICSDTRSFKLQDVFTLENEGSDDVTTLIDKKVKTYAWIVIENIGQYLLCVPNWLFVHYFAWWQDNVFVMSNKKSKYPVLQVDVRSILVLFYLDNTAEWT